MTRRNTLFHLSNYTSGGTAEMTVSPSITALIPPQQSSVCTPQPSLLSSFIMTHPHTLTYQHHITLVFQSPLGTRVTYRMCRGAYTNNPPTRPIPLQAGAHWFLTSATHRCRLNSCSVISCSITQGDTNQEQRQKQG